MGELFCKNNFEAQTIAKRIIDYITSNEPGLDALVGLQSMFGNSQCTVYDGNLQQLDRLARSIGLRQLGQCVLVSPKRALFNLFPTADKIKIGLSGDESLWTALFRWRKSGLQQGAIFAKAAAPREHIAAQKKRIAASRLPRSEGAKLQNQVQIEVLGIDAQNHEDLPRLIMQKTSEIHGVEFTEQVDYASELEFGEWRPVLRDERWTGCIQVLCPESLSPVRLYRSVNGRSICRNGFCKSLAVTSLYHDSLAAEAFNEHEL